MTEKLKDQAQPIVEPIVVSEGVGEIDIPKQALREFAKFLLPLIQADLNTENQKKAG